MERFFAEERQNRRQGVARIAQPRMGAVDNGTLVRLPIGQRGVSEGNLAVKPSGYDSDRRQKHWSRDVSDKGIPVGGHIGKRGVERTHNVAFAEVSEYGALIRRTEHHDGFDFTAFLLRHLRHCGTQKNPAHAMSQEIHLPGNVLTPQSPPIQIKKDLRMILDISFG